LFVERVGELMNLTKQDLKGEAQEDVHSPHRIFTIGTEHHGFLVCLVTACFVPEFDSLSEEYRSSFIQR